MIWKNLSKVENASIGKSNTGQCLAALALCVALLDSNVAMADRLLDISAKSSLDARDHCQVLMHEDADAFTQCADELIRNAPVNTQEQKFAKLGISYYAWLSATSAAKNGLPSAAASSEHFVLIFRPLQKRLLVSDDALCVTIPGDCKSRNARMLIVEKEALEKRTGKTKAEPVR